MFGEGEDAGRRWTDLLSVILSAILLPVEWNGNNTRLSIGARSSARPQGQRKPFNVVLCSSFNGGILSSPDKTAASML